MQDPEAIYGHGPHIELLCKEQVVFASQFVEELVKALASIAEEDHALQLSDALVTLRLLHVDAT